MNTKEIKPVRIENGQMNRRGQVIIPKGIREVFNEVFDLQNNMSLEIQLLPSGTIQLVPIKKFPVSLFMETDDELLESAARAYADKGSGSYASDAKIKELLRK